METEINRNCFLLIWALFLNLGTYFAESFKTTPKPKQFGYFYRCLDVVCIQQWVLFLKPVSILLWKIGSYKRKVPIYAHHPVFGQFGPGV